MHFIAVRNANVFDLISRTILEPVELRTNMRKLLTHIVSLKIVSATLAETPFSQYLDLLIALTQHVSEKSKSLDCDDTRLNHSLTNPLIQDANKITICRQTDFGSESRKGKCTEKSMWIKLCSRVIWMRKV